MGIEGFLVGFTIPEDQRSVRMGFPIQGVFLNNYSAR